MSVSDICHWLQGIFRSKIGVKSDVVNVNSSDWNYSAFSAAMSEDTLEICTNFYKVWNVILEHIQPNQNYPSSPLQLLKFLFHELIIHEMELALSEKISNQLIYTSNSEAETEAAENSSDQITSFMASLGSDFLTRIRGSPAMPTTAVGADEHHSNVDEYVKLVAVKQEVFEQQVMSIRKFSMHFHNDFFNFFF